MPAPYPLDPIGGQANEWPPGLDGGMWPWVFPDDWCGEHPDFPAYIAISTAGPPQ